MTPTLPTLAEQEPTPAVDFTLTDIAARCPYCDGQNATANQLRAHIITLQQAFREYGSEAARMQDDLMATRRRLQAVLDTNETLRIELEAQHQNWQRDRTKATELTERVRELESRLIELASSFPNADPPNLRIYPAKPDEVPGPIAWAAHELEEGEE